MKRVKARRSLNAAKEVSIRKLSDGWCIDLPDWEHDGNYHMHIRHRRWDELTALRECIEEVEKQCTPS